MIEYLKESSKTEIKFQIKVFLPFLIMVFGIWYLVFSDKLDIKDIILLSFINTLNIYMLISIFIKPPNIGIDCYPENFRGFLRVSLFVLSCYIAYVLIAHIFNFTWLPYSLS